MLQPINPDVCPEPLRTLQCSLTVHIQVLKNAISVQHTYLKHSEKGGQPEQEQNGKNRLVPGTNVRMTGAAKR